MESRDYYYIVLEYCNEGTLADYIYNKPDKRLSEEEAVEILR
jgi:serine/threonine protein kinase